MAIEKDIIDAVNATGLFVSVSYLVADSDVTNEDVTSLPIFVLSDIGRDFSGALTFCGTGGLVIGNYEAMILAPTAAECRSLEQATVVAISGLGNVTGAQDSYDEELGAFVSTLTIVT